jgi:GTP-binding protein
VPAGATGERPLVAIVGRPNVGKSTLFNRLSGHRLTIAHDTPGVTRDRHYAEAEALGKPYILIDTGGFDPESDDPRTEGIVRQVNLALEECDIVICVLDASAEPLEADRRAVSLLRQAGKPVFFVANKADSKQRTLASLSLYELGVEDVLPVSAMHGHGLGDLEERLAEVLPLPPEGETEEGLPEVPRLAIVGRPNAGKSSLVNRLCGADRVLVDARPGTTVDSVDTLFERGEDKLVLIDTAGMRRKRAKKESVETLSIYQAIRAIERSDVVLLLVDAENGVAEQDAKIAGLAEERGRGLIIGLNKMDLLSDGEQRQAVRRARDVLSFVPWAPIVKVSAKTGRGMNKLVTRVSSVVSEHRKRVTTGQVNRFFEEVLEHHPPPTFHKRPVRLYYVTQASAAPPTFIVVTNEPRGVHFSYQRYVVNQLRERFGFEGSPVKVRYRGKSRKRG